jgi:hypothetical protein
VHGQGRRAALSLQHVGNHQARGSARRPRRWAQAPAPRPPFAHRAGAPGPLVGIRPRTGEVSPPRLRFWRLPLSAIEGNVEVLCSLGAFRILTHSRLAKRYPGQAVSPERSSRTGRSPPSWTSEFGRAKLVSHNRKQYSRERDRCCMQLRASGRMVLDS